MDGYILCRSRQNIHIQWFKNLLETARCRIISNWLMDQILGQGMLFVLISYDPSMYLIRHIIWNSISRILFL